MHHCNEVTTVITRGTRIRTELIHNMNSFSTINFALHSPMRQLSKGWGDNSGFSDHTLTTNIDVSKVPTDNTTTLDYGLCVRVHEAYSNTKNWLHCSCDLYSQCTLYLSIENDIFASTQDTSSTHLISRGLK